MHRPTKYGVAVTLESCPTAAWKNKAISKLTKVKLYETLVLSISLCVATLKRGH